MCWENAGENHTAHVSEHHDLYISEIGGVRSFLGSATLHVMKAMNDPTARAGPRTGCMRHGKRSFAPGTYDMMLVTYVPALSLFLPSLMQP